MKPVIRCYPAFGGYCICSSTGGSRYLTKWEVFWWKLGILSPRYFDWKYFTRPGACERNMKRDAAPEKR